MGPYVRIQSDADTLTLTGTVTGNYELNQWVLQGAGNILVSGQITGSSALVSGSVGAGTRTLINPANNFTANISINGGTLKLGASEVIPDGVGKGNVSVAGVGTLDLNGFSETINGLSGTGSVDNKATSTTSTLTIGGNNQGGTFNGVIQNSGGKLALTKMGSGTLTLTGTNTYSGNTTVNGGTLAFAVVSLATNATVSVTAGAVLQLDFADINVVSGFKTNGVFLPAGVYSAANVAVHCRHRQFGSRQHNSPATDPCAGDSVRHQPGGFGADGIRVQLRPSIHHEPCADDLLE